jgi:hypothetical protein
VHLLLTDRLSCPRCGPEFGLILLADRMGPERRVIDGGLGCANCRDRFPVEGGFTDLRAPPRGTLPSGRAGDPAPPDEAESSRLQALLGVVEGPGMVACVGMAARHAQGLAERIEGLALVAIDPDLVGWPDVPGVSRLASRPGIPLFSQTLRGAVIDGGLGADWIEEGARVVARLGRVVVVDAEDGTAQALEGAGLSVLASEAGTVVAARG